MTAVTAGGRESRHLAAISKGRSAVAHRRLGCARSFSPVVAACGLLMIGTIVVAHPTNIRQANAAGACPAAHSQIAMADGGKANHAQRLLVADAGNTGLSRRVLVSDERDGDTGPQAVMAATVVPADPC